MAQQLQKTPLLEHALDQRRQFRRALGRDGLAIRGAPRHEAFQIGGQRTDARRDAIGRHQQRIGIKQRRNLLLVSLQLVERVRQMRARAARRFQFDHRQRQTVDEQHHVGAAVELALRASDALLKVKR